MWRGVLGNRYPYRDRLISKILQSCITERKPLTSEESDEQERFSASAFYLP